MAPAIKTDATFPRSKRALPQATRQLRSNETGENGPSADGETLVKRISPPRRASRFRLFLISLTRPKAKRFKAI